LKKEQGVRSHFKSDIRSSCRSPGLSVTRRWVTVR
jgi:hypothetical protein